MKSQSSFLPSLFERSAPPRGFNLELNQHDLCMIFLQNSSRLHHFRCLFFKSLSLFGKVSSVLQDHSFHVLGPSIVTRPPSTAGPPPPNHHIRIVELSLPLSSSAIPYNALPNPRLVPSHLNQPFLEDALAIVFISAQEIQQSKRVVRFPPSPF